MGLFTAVTCPYVPTNERPFKSKTKQVACAAYQSTLARVNDICNLFLYLTAEIRSDEAKISARPSFIQLVLSENYIGQTKTTRNPHSRSHRPL